MVSLFTPCTGLLVKGSYDETRYMGVIHQGLGSYYRPNNPVTEGGFGLYKPVPAFRQSSVHQLLSQSKQYNLSFHSISKNISLYLLLFIIVFIVSILYQNSSTTCNEHFSSLSSSSPSPCSSSTQPLHPTRSLHSTEASSARGPDHQQVLFQLIYLLQFHTKI